MKFFIWLVLFLVFPLPFRGACIATAGVDCPSWIPAGGLDYTLDFFQSFINIFYYEGSISSYVWARQSLVYLPWIVLAAGGSLVATSLIFALIKRVKKKNK